MRLRRWAMAACSLAVAASVSSAAPAYAMLVADPAGPDYEMPFPCGEEWTGTTRGTHRPSINSIDFNRADDLGDIMVSAAPGVVSRVADLGDNSYGKHVIVDHGDGRSTLYAHLANVWVTAGQPVDQATTLGLVGETGGVTGPHLHFEERLADAVQQPYFHDTDYAFGSTTASLNCPDVPLAGDWNNDRTDEVAVFRRGADAGVFRLYIPDATPRAITFGRSSDSPVVGDWDGDGQTDVGVRRPGRRTFLLRAADGTSTALRLGARTDVPVTGDWNGDGLTDVGLWRPGRAKFRLLNESGEVDVVALGSVGSLPVTGDWDGNNVSDVGVFDPATDTFTLRTIGADGSPVLSTVTFGADSDLPVTGDWDGDGRTDVGVWAPDTAMYSLRVIPRSGRMTDTVIRQRFGHRR